VWDYTKGQPVASNCVVKRKPKIFLSVALALLFSIIDCRVCLADNIPDSYSGPWAYFSTDMSPVEVNIAKIFYDHNTETYRTGTLVDPDSPRFVEGPPIVKATIPRAYINVFGDYSSRALSPEFRHDNIPDKAFGESLVMMMTYPDGLPYSIAWSSWDDRKPDMSQPGMGAQANMLQSKKDILRATRIKAQVRYSAPFDARDRVLVTIGSGHTLTSTVHDGFQVYSHKSLPEQAYVDDGPDEIRLIRCLSPIEKSVPSFFCTYYVPLNDKLLVELDFLDFRLNGGRKFARDRVRLFKKIMCPKLQCDAKAIEAARVGK
jgi:hypothetical protein